MQALSTEALQEQLSQELALWQLNDNALERVYRGSSYLDALDKLNAIARHAEAVNHHPDLALHWKTLIIRYWTHTAHGVTELDLEQARYIESFLA
jgi:4a-hydroxytetrahydrobiopterin dehydratase